MLLYASVPCLLNPPDAALLMSLYALLPFLIPPLHCERQMGLASFTPSPFPTFLTTSCASPPASSFPLCTVGGKQGLASSSPSHVSNNKLCLTPCVPMPLQTWQAMQQAGNKSRPQQMHAQS
eukprot:957642-Pelagomonas_calceolata.AAC.1